MSIIYKDEIMVAISDLFENKVRPRMESNCPLPGGTYVIDFGVIPKDKNRFDSTVIEINSFEKL